MLLTRREREIVDQGIGSMTMVLGRSGTGKTFCLCGRMDQDADLHEQRRVTEERKGRDLVSQSPSLLANTVFFYTR